MGERVPVTKEELEEHLANQIYFIKRSSKLFDGGNHQEALAISVNLRLLLSDKGSNRPLLRQLGLSARPFLNTGLTNFEGNKASWHGLLHVAIGPQEVRFYAPLGSAPFTEFLPFGDWWHKPVLIDASGRLFTREDLVLSVADQEGAHVDHAIGQKYADLKRNKFLGVNGIIGGQEFNLEYAAHHSIRQIAYETLKTIDPEFVDRHVSDGSLEIFGAGIITSKVELDPRELTDSLLRQVGLSPKK